MAYRFKNSESAERGLRRIADEQFGKILALLARDPDGETTIHESRKSLKRLKALLKLARKGLDRDDYRRAYGAVRDAGRLLSGARDFEVMPNTLAAVRVGREDLDKAAVHQVEAAIAQARRDFEQTWDRRAACECACRALTAARRRVAKIKIDGGFEILAKGAGQCLGDVKEQGALALESGRAEDFHEWRKSVQLHWRHLRLLEGVWPDAMAARITIARALADVLGLDHDLAVLDQFIAALPAGRFKAKARKALADAIAERQQQLRNEATAYAGLIIADDPSGFCDRLIAYRSAQRRIAALDLPVTRLGADGDET